MADFAAMAPYVFFVRRSIIETEANEVRTFLMFKANERAFKAVWAHNER
jgi:hypothetical protein